MKRYWLIHFTLFYTAEIVSRIWGVLSATHVPYLFGIKKLSRQREEGKALSERRQSVAKVICPPSPYFGARRRVQRLIDYATLIALCVPFCTSLRLEKDSREFGIVISQCNKIRVKQKALWHLLYFSQLNCYRYLICIFNFLIMSCNFFHYSWSRCTSSYLMRAMFHGR